MLAALLTVILWQLLLTFPSLQFADNMGDSVTNSLTEGAFEGSNENATDEIGEPSHVRGRPKSRAFQSGLRGSLQATVLLL